MLNKKQLKNYRGKLILNWISRKLCVNKPPIRSTLKS